MDNQRILAVVYDYKGLVDAFKAWVAELNVARETLDSVAGLPDKYAQKLLAPVPVKGVGRTSLGPLLGALGLKLIVAVDHEQLERIRHRLDQRSEADVKRETSNANGRMLTGKRRKKSATLIHPGTARMMRSRGVLMLTPRKRSRIARLAARTRWKRYRSS